MCTELVKLCVTIDAQATATDGSGEDEDDAADDDRSRRHDDYLDDDLSDPDDDDLLPPPSSINDGDMDDLARLAEATSDADDDDHVARTASVATIRTATRRGVDGRTTGVTENDDSKARRRRSVRKTVDKRASAWRRKSHRAPRWVEDVASCFQFKVLFSYDFRKSSHINIQEALAYRTLIRHLSRYRPGHRVAILQDSRVVLGAAGKGRSSSPHLNRILCSALPFIIGAELYPNSIQVPSKFNSADDPSRYVQIRAARSECAAWISPALKGVFRMFEAVRVADEFIGPIGWWMRLLSGLVVRHGHLFGR